MPAYAAELPRTPAEATAEVAPVLVDIVVLSDDLELYQATRDAVGERNPVWRARTAAESVDLLLTGRCGVLLLDLAAVSTQPASLVRQVVDQFPDVVVVVAGGREDESRLGQLISDGLVYRFMHKPLSPKRAGMFLTAAIRSHAERRDDRARLPLLPAVGLLRHRLDPARWLFVGGGLVLLLIVLGVVVAARHDAAPVAEPRAQRQPAPQAERGDPVLAAARAALAAGRYEAPPGRNALDLYAAVLLAQPDQPEARTGLAEVTGRLLGQARSAAAAGNPEEARRLALRVLQADAAHAGAKQLLARFDSQIAARRALPAPSAVAAEAAAPTGHRADAPQTARPGVEESGAGGTAAGTQADGPRIPRSLVPPDPLTPRVAGGPAAVRQAPRGSRTHSYGAPISLGHPTAGLAVPERTPAEALSGGPPDPAAPATPGVDSRDLEAIATPAPEYPLQALRQRVEGWVEVEFTVDEGGVTRDIVIVAAEPGGVFDAAATSAVAGWRYLPRVVNGHAVAQRSSMTLRFSLEN